jgi:hypothetical protein
LPEPDECQLLQLLEEHPIFLCSIQGVRLILMCKRKNLATANRPDLTSKAGIGYDLVKFSSVTSMNPHLQFLENYMGFQ